MRRGNLTHPVIARSVLCDVAISCILSLRGVFCATWQSHFEILQIGGVKMKRILKVVIVSLLFSVFVNAQVGNKEEILNKVADVYKGSSDISGDIEIGMLMMGSTMEIPGKFWKSGEKFRMEMKITAPNMPQPMEQIIVSDGKTMWQFQKTMNMVTVIDFTKLPEEMRNKIKNQQNFFGLNENFGKKASEMGDKWEFSTKIKNGKEFYVFEINDFADIAGNLPMKTGQNMQLFKKMLLWIEPASYYVHRIEIYGESEEPGMWIEFRNLNTASISPSLFKFEIPKDAKVMDMTEMMMKMTEKMKQPTEQIKQPVE